MSTSVAEVAAPEASAPEELLTYDQVAEVLKVCRSIAQRLVYAGEIRAVPVGKRLRRVRRADLDAYIRRLAGE